MIKTEHIHLEQTADDTTVALAVVMRDIVGGTVYDENVVSKAKSNVITTNKNIVYGIRFQQLV